MAYLTKQQVVDIIQKAPPGTSPAGIVASLRSNGHQLEGYTEQAAPPEKSKIGSVIDTVAKPFQAASKFLFGSTGRAVGGLITGGIGGVASLTGNEDLGSKLQKSAAEAVTPGAIAGTVLEAGGAAGLGEKTIAKVAGKIAGPLAIRAEKLYKSALRPTEAALKKAPGVVKAGLEEGIRVSSGGKTKLVGIIDDIGEEIGKVIDDGVAKGKTVDVKNLTPYLDEMKEYFKNVIGGDKMIKEVDTLGKEWVGALGKKLPIEKAQAVKQATQKFVAKYYNRQAPLSFEVQKQLARGLKDEIAKQVPEIAKLNARDSKLIQLDDILESTLSKVDKRNLIGLNDIASFGAGVVGGGTAQAGAAVSLARRIIESPALKSQAAISLNKLAKNGAALMVKGRYGAALTTAKILQVLFPEKD